ncbi:TonB-dependent receptor [Hymenobacter rubripertinctus]|nr:carboxypeptidase-like regulatory domain-containing protein [Hymenobacter rubripertinctus]
MRNLPVHRAPETGSPIMAAGLFALMAGIWAIPSAQAGACPPAAPASCSVMPTDTTRARPVRGSVADKAQKGLEFSTVHLLRHSDSTHVATVMSDEKGAFEFPAVRPGEYLVKVTQLSYTDTYLPFFRVESGEGILQLPPIVMGEFALGLDEVVVVGEKQVIERQIDRFVVNVGAMPVAAGGSVYDVLKSSPGVTVNSTESITMMGKTGVIVMIDDRPVKMSSDALLNMLKNMPAESVSPLEVITTPPARYEAQGDAGIINIRTKRRKTEGWNADLSLRGGQGRYSRYSGGGVLNVKKRMIDFNLSYFAGRVRNFQNIGQRATFRRTGQAEVFSDVLSQTYLINTATSQDLKAQADIKTGKRSAMGIAATAFRLPNPACSDNTSSDLLRTAQLDTTVNTLSQLNDIYRSYSLDGYYKTALDTL